VYQSNICEISQQDSYRKKLNFQYDIELFLKEYTGNKLFTCVPGRCHPTFPKFSFNTGMKHPEKLKERLVKYGKNLDRSRAVFN
jgi:hypothetical protein